MRRLSLHRLGFLAVFLLAACKSTAGGTLTTAPLQVHPQANAIAGAPATTRLSGLVLAPAAIVAAGGGNIIAGGGGNIIAGGGGNIVAAGGGNIIAGGGGNLSNPVAGGGASLVAVGHGNIVAAGGGNIVAAGGGNIVAAGGGNIVAAGGGNIIAGGGGNLQAVPRTWRGLLATSAALRQAPIAGIRVHLTDAKGRDVGVPSVLTDAKGHYAFSGVPLNGHFIVTAVVGNEAPPAKQRRVLAVAATPTLRTLENPFLVGVAKDTVSTDDGRAAAALTLPSQASGNAVAALYLKAIASPGADGDEVDLSLASTVITETFLSAHPDGDGVEEGAYEKAVDELGSHLQEFDLKTLPADVLDAPIQEPTDAGAVTGLFQTWSEVVPGLTTAVDNLTTTVGEPPADAAPGDAPTGETTTVDTSGSDGSDGSNGAVEEAPEPTPSPPSAGVGVAVTPGAVKTPVPPEAIVLQ